MPEESHTTLPAELDDAIGRLRARGWTVCPPPSEEIPDPQVGQIWRSPSPRIEARTVVAVGPHRSWGGTSVSFISPSRPPNPKWGPFALHITGWKKWARKSGARPENVHV